MIWSYWSWTQAAHWCLKTEKPRNRECTSSVIHCTRLIGDDEEHVIYTNEALNLLQLGSRRPVLSLLQCRQIFKHQSASPVDSKNYNLLWESLREMQCPERFLGIISRDPVVSNTNWLHVDIFQLSFCEVEEYSSDSSNLISNFPEVLDLNWLFLKLNRFICN